jgi:hypothetical protein
MASRFSTTSARFRPTFALFARHHLGRWRRELASLSDRFTEGFGTSDLVTAKQLLDELGTSDHD